MILKFGMFGIGPLELVIFAVIAILSFTRQNPRTPKKLLADNFRHFAGNHTKRR